MTLYVIQLGELAIESHPQNHWRTILFPLPVRGHARFRRLRTGRIALRDKSENDAVVVENLGRGKRRIGGMPRVPHLQPQPTRVAEPSPRRFDGKIDSTALCIWRAGRRAKALRCDTRCEIRSELSKIFRSFAEVRGHQKSLMSGNLRAILHRR